VLKTYDGSNYYAKINAIMHYTKEKFIPSSKTRAFTLAMIEHFKENNITNVIGCEIGVDKGFNAINMIHMLEKNNITVDNLILVDPYTTWVEFIKNKRVEQDYSSHKTVARKRLMKYNGKYTFIFRDSKDAVEYVRSHLPSCGAHFIYIDGCHTHEGVKSDINKYYPLVIKNGVMGGHDFCAHWQGVSRAVLEFVDEHNLKLFGSNIDWWVVKY